MHRKVAKPDLLLAEIAKKQHGIVSFSQLRRSGLGEEAIRARVHAGRLHRLYRGVYAVGHVALAPEGRWMAGVLALGRGPDESSGAVFDRWGAAVSHRSAAFLWGLLLVTQSPCDVVVSGNGGRARRPGLRVHRSLTLAPADVTLRRGIPVTTPARTIADLRAAVSAGWAWAISDWELRRAIRQASVLGLPLGEADSDSTRSDLEEDFLKICGRHRLPRPRVNVRVGPHLVDFLWPERRVVVETDSYLYHRGKAAFQDDRARDLDLKRRGFEVLRLSEREVNEQPEVVVEVLAATLHGGWTRKP